MIWITLTFTNVHEQTTHLHTKPSSKFWNPPNLSNCSKQVPNVILFSLFLRGKRVNKIITVFLFFETAEILILKS